MISVPVVGQEIRPWSQTSRQGNRADRTLTEIAVCVPGTIAGLSFLVPPEVLGQFSLAERKVLELDITFGQSLAALSSLLVRTESLGSSRIEHIEAPDNEVAKALHGSKATADAVSIVAAARALDRLLAAADRGRITLDDVLSAHHDLMINDQYESRYAGVFRPMQNWIGGSDHSPRNADMIPPAPDMVADLMHDLLAFIARTDMPIFLQAAIAHAQFETIHPFTDGNGRIGRALVNAIFRLRKLTSTVVVPMASALVANRQAYFSDLKTYRDGDVEPLALRFVQSTVWATDEAMATGKTLVSMQETWHTKLGRTRANSAHMKLLPLLLTQPVVNASDIEQHLKINTSVAYLAIERLLTAGILHPITERQRNQMWAAADVMDELFDLDERIQSRATEK